MTPLWVALIYINCIGLQQTPPTVIKADIAHEQFGRGRAVIVVCDRQVEPARGRDNGRFYTTSVKR